MPETPTLRGSPGPLNREYDALLADLDGVVFRGSQPIAHAGTSLADARRAGMRIAFVTNNASRTPEQVAAHLRKLGVSATPDEIATAAMAAASRLAAQLPAGARVLIVGGEGLTAAVRDAGLQPVSRADDGPAAVVQGWAPTVDWEQLSEGCIAIRAGAPWLATNLDATLPSDRGPLPGNGSLVAALTAATGKAPESVGKPEPPMFEEACRISGGQRPLVVGDRLETDIAGGRRAGLPTLCVLTGVTTAASLLTASAEQRPDYLGLDLSALGATHPDVRFDRAFVTVGSARASVAGARVTVEFAPDAVADPVDGLRALCALTWAGRTAPDAAKQALDTLDLDSR